MSANTSPAADVSRSAPASRPMLGDADNQPPFRKAPWTFAILLAGVAGWLAYTFPPATWRVPDSMLHIGALSPASDQAKLKAVENSNLWRNTLVKFTMAGLGIGLVGLMRNVSSLGRRWPAALATLASGAIGGALAGTLGLLLRKYLDLDHPFPLVSAEIRPYIADGLVFSLISILLLLPVSVSLLFQPLKSDRHKAFAVPLAGLLTGLLVPIVGALLLSGYTNISFFPPAGADLTVLWFASMSVLAALIVAFHGQKPAKAPASAA